jgi:hypothetical protein
MGGGNGAGGRQGVQIRMIPTIGRRGTKRLVSALTAGMVVLLIAAACGGDSEKTVTGLIVEAVERDLVEIELLRVRDDDGKVWTFSTEGPVGINAAHLRQHQVLGEKVVVTYSSYRGDLIATGVRDLVAPGN